MLWEVEIHPAEGQTDREGSRIAEEAKDVGAMSIHEVRTARSYLIEGEMTEQNDSTSAAALLADGIVERCVVRPLPAESSNGATLINVLFKPGVTDNVGATATRALKDLGLNVERVATCRKYWVNADATEEDVSRLATKVLANDSIERVIRGPLPLTSIAVGGDYTFSLQTTHIRELPDAELSRLSKVGQLYLSLAEMQTIQRYFVDLGREPTDVELETIAQTWSEHCSHKTLAGRIAYRDENGERHFDNMLKETVFAATQTIREQLGDDDLCVSVFKDNAGIVTFDDKQDVCIKVETHNHPSALEPYGGANTGIGGKEKLAKNAFTESAAGDCLDWAAGNPGDPKKVDCQLRHRFEVAGPLDTALLPGSEFGESAPWPGVARFAQIRDEQCAVIADRYLGGKRDPHGRFSVSMMFPSQVQWDKGARELRCGLQQTGPDGQPAQFSGRVADQDQSFKWAPGTCVGIDAARKPTVEVNCTENHAFQTTGTVDLSVKFGDRLSGRPWPSKDEQNAFLASVCPGQAERFMGGKAKLEATTLNTQWSVILEPSWLAGSRTAVCYLGLPDQGGFATLVGDARETLLINGKLPVPPPQAPPGRALPTPVPLPGGYEANPVEVPAPAG